MTETTSPLRDPELVRLLADEPELLAIADALVETQDGRLETRPLPRGRRWTLPSIVVATGVAAAAVALLLVSPWGGSSGLVQRALAAVGTGPVLHVVIEQPVPQSMYNAVALPSGTPIQATERREIWFDQSRDLKKEVATEDGVLFYQVLETPQGAYIPEGNPLNLCAWNATRQRFSCTEINENATGPNEPGPAPTLETAFAGFVDHYQSALASGDATKTGTGDVDGHQVIWLHINPDSMGSYPAEDVAIDASTYVPVLVRTVDPNPVQFTVTEIDTQPYDASRFTPPPREYPPTSVTTGPTTSIDATQAPSLLGGQAFWLGQTWNGYQLAKVEQQQVTADYAAQSGKQPTQSVAVTFIYAPPGGSAASPGALQIGETTQCSGVVSENLPCSGGIEPTEGVLFLDPHFFSSYTMRNGIYVTIRQNSSTSDPVAVANALRPLSVSRN